MEEFGCTLGVGYCLLCQTRSVVLWLLQASEFSAFVDHAGLVGEGFQLSEVDTVFIACNVDMSKKKLNPERSLSRYEFMEAIVRIAHAKYNKSKLVIWVLWDVRMGVSTRRRSQLAQRATVQHCMVIVD